MLIALDGTRSERRRPSGGRGLCGVSARGAVCGDIPQAASRDRDGCVCVLIDASLSVCACVCLCVSVHMGTHVYACMFVCMCVYVCHLGLEHRILAFSTAATSMALNSIVTAVVPHRETDYAKGQ